MGLDDNNNYYANVSVPNVISLCSCIATGQSSTPFRVNPTPEHLLKGEIMNNLILLALTGRGGGLLYLCPFKILYWRFHTL